MYKKINAIKRILFIIFVLFLYTETIAKVPEVVLKEQTYEGYIEYFKECNKNYISSRSEIVRDIKNDKKIIYLTFDDGPNVHFDDIVSVLKKYNIKATFFVINSWNKNNIKRMKEEGHTVAIHSATHNMYEIYKSELDYLSDLYIMQKGIYDVIGEYPHYIRFPGGSNNIIATSINPGIMQKLITLVQEIGFEYFDWNVSTGDSYSKTTKEQIIANVKKGLSYNYKDNIVLMHDLFPHTIEALPEIIEYAKEQGYEFDVINDNTEHIHFIVE